MSDINAKIGKNVIESLTLGMYENEFFIFREYVQNAVDQIDKAVVLGLVSDVACCAVHIDINHQEKKICIEDDATGIKKENAVSLLVDIASSKKDRKKDRGFRGIGRLGGLGYCEKLVFETSFAGEPFQSVISWDAKKLRENLNSDNDMEAHELIESVVSVDVLKAKSSDRYFKVKMFGVTNESLLDETQVKKYLSMVAPVPIISRFIFKSKIEEIYEKHNYFVDEYKIQVGLDGSKEEIFKPYTDKIYKTDKSQKKCVDEIIKICPIEIFDRKKEKLLAIGWHSTAQKNQSIPAFNTMRGIRLRKGNIQIGDSDALKKLFGNNDRFHNYYIGELHVLDPNLTPNARRDYFEEDADGFLTYFEKQVSSYFQNDLYKYAYLSSDINSLNKKAEEKEKLIQERQQIITIGVLDKSDIEKIDTKIGEIDKAIDKDKSKINNKISKLNEGSMKETMTNRVKLVETSIDDNKDIQKIDNKITHRTDRLSSLSRKERKLISKVYTVIKNILPPEESKTVVDAIEEELNK